MPQNSYTKPLSGTYAYVQKHIVQYTDIATQTYNNKDNKQSKQITTITY